MNCKGVLFLYLVHFFEGFVRKQIFDYCVIYMKNMSHMFRGHPKFLTVMFYLCHHKIISFEPELFQNLGEEKL